MKNINSICGLPLSGNSVDFIYDFYIEDKHYKIFVGGCSDYSNNAHFHILSGCEEIIIGFNKERAFDLLNTTDSVDIKEVLAFIEDWLNQPNEYYALFGSNLQFVETFWNINNENCLLPVTPNEQLVKPSITNELTVTVFTKTDERNEKGYVFFITNEELAAFNYRIGDTFLDNPIVDIQIT